MDVVHRVLTAIFDAILTPLEWMGDIAALVVVSGIFGILALLVFKQISWQAGIKATKDKIKGHMIAIRIYQDDLGIVFSSVLKVVLRNFQYLGLNFGPILPLFVPFVLIAAQLVVRYGFDPLPVVDAAEAETLLPGRGNMLEVRMKPEFRSQVADLSIDLPPYLRALSPLARSARDGIAVLEFVAISRGDGSLECLIAGRPAVGKRVVSGDVEPRALQPERVSGFFESWLWPAEPTLPSDSPIASIAFSYPDKSLGMLPGGAGGVLLTFFLASLVFGLAVLKPMNIQI